MKFYTSGNFLYMAKMYREKRFIKEATYRYGFTFNRLVSFFFPRECKNVFDAVNGLETNKKGVCYDRSKAIKRRKK